ncbi:MAG: adenylyl-sulfate kinase [Nitrososphaerota archaeon]|nr:adenylyl-sulfate kinase [Nitrososphaerota archaeon]
MRAETSWTELRATGVRPTPVWTPSPRLVRTPSKEGGSSQGTPSVYPGPLPSSACETRPRPAPRREKRDPKGLYARARRGEITNMTGIQDPYEEPTGPDLVVDTSESTPEASVNELVAWLRRLRKL